MVRKWSNIASLFRILFLYLAFGHLSSGKDRFRRSNFELSLEKDVFISVKTTFRFHDTRVKEIVDTWFKLAPKNVYFFTDRPDLQLNRKLEGHLIVTDCPSSHSRWMCHFDDDNYVNIPQMFRLLSNFDPHRDWYLGRPSTQGPIKIGTYTNDQVSFWFATGGAGFCLSKSLITKMSAYIRGGKFTKLCDTLRLPDDVTLGYLIEHLLNKRLTVIVRLHSHLENMKSLQLTELDQQISIGAGSYNAKHKNVVQVPRLFRDSDDPERFRSVHCFLFPKSSICPRYNGGNTADGV